MKSLVSDRVWVLFNCSHLISKIVLFYGTFFPRVSFSLIAQQCKSLYCWILTHGLQVISWWSPQLCILLSTLLTMKVLPTATHPVLHIVTHKPEWLGIKALYFESVSAFESSNEAQNIFTCGPQIRSKSRNQRRECRMAYCQGFLNSFWTKIFNNWLCKKQELLRLQCSH